MIANKIFSINLAAFIYLVSKIEPRLSKDQNGNVFFIFPNDPSVSLIINVYRGNRVNVDLKDYLESYRYIRSMMRTFK